MLVSNQVSISNQESEDLKIAIDNVCIDFFAAKSGIDSIINHKLEISLLLGPTKRAIKIVIEAWASRSGDIHYELLSIQEHRDETELRLVCSLNEIKNDLHHRLN